MPIIVNLDVMMAKRKISSNELAEKIEITPANFPFLKREKQQRCGSPRWSACARYWTASREICLNIKKTRNKYSLIPSGISVPSVFQFVEMEKIYGKQQ